jgi:hypothetical protein
MMEQEPVNEPEPKPDEPKETPKPDEPPPLGTNLKGDGPADGFGLGSGNGNGLGAGNVIGGQGGGKQSSRWGWYAGLVQNQVAEALRQHNKTKNADLRIRLRIWPDASGRIERVVLGDSSGDPAIDEAIKNEVLSGLRLSEAPPSGMPLPIVLRVTARRPS